MDIEHNEKARFTVITRDSQQVRSASHGGGYNLSDAIINRILFINITSRSPPTER